MTLSEDIKALEWLFPMTDSRHTKIAALAARVEALEVQNAALKEQLKDVPRDGASGTCSTCGYPIWYRRGWYHWQFNDHVNDHAATEVKDE